MKLLYICAPFKTRTPEEDKLTKDAIRSALTGGWCPIFMPYVLGEIDHDPHLRELALMACETVIPACRSILVVGARRTEGMARDLKCWTEFHGPHVDTDPNLYGYIMTSRRQEKAAGLEESARICEDLSERERPGADTLLLKAAAMIRELKS